LTQHTALSFRGAGKARDPGIHNPAFLHNRDQGLWIPALAALGRNDVLTISVASQD